VRPFFEQKDCVRQLEVSAALLMAAVAIDLNSVASALTGCTAVFTIMRDTTTHGILTSLFLVCHEILLKCSIGFGKID